MQYKTMNNQNLNSVKSSHLKSESHKDRIHLDDNTSIVAQDATYREMNVVSFKRSFSRLLSDYRLDGQR